MGLALEKSKKIFEKTDAAQRLGGFNMARFVFLGGDFGQNLFYHPIMGNGSSRDVLVSPTYLCESIYCCAILSWLFLIINSESWAHGL